MEAQACELEGNEADFESFCQNPTWFPEKTDAEVPEQCQSTPLFCQTIRTHLSSFPLMFRREGWETDAKVRNTFHKGDKMVTGNQNYTRTFDQEIGRNWNCKTEGPDRNLSQTP